MPSSLKAAFSARRFCCWALSSAPLAGALPTGEVRYASGSATERNAFLHQLHKAELCGQLLETVTRRFSVLQPSLLLLTLRLYCPASLVQKSWPTLKGSGLLL